MDEHTNTEISESLSESEVLAAAAEEQQQLLEARERRIAELESALGEMHRMRERQAVRQALSERGLSPELADILAPVADEEARTAQLDVLQTAFQRAVEREVRTRLAGGPAPAKGSTPAAGVSRDRFRRMTLRQQQELYLTDPEAWRRLAE